MWISAGIVGIAILVFIYLIARDGKGKFRKEPGLHAAGAQVVTDEPDGEPAESSPFT